MTSTEPRRNIEELMRLAADCGWEEAILNSGSISFVHPDAPGEKLVIPTWPSAAGFAERYDAALARLTPEPHAHAAAPAGAMEAIAEILREVDPRTWVEHTPSGLAYHLAQAAYPAMVAQAHADAAFIARYLCHWMQGVGDALKESHEQSHYGNVCPYEAVAAVLTGQPDPRAEEESADARTPDLPDDLHDFFTYLSSMPSDYALERVHELAQKYAPASATDTN